VGLCSNHTLAADAPTYLGNGRVSAFSTTTSVPSLHGFRITPSDLFRSNLLGAVSVRTGLSQLCACAIELVKVDSTIWGLGVALVDQVSAWRQCKPIQLDWLKWCIPSGARTCLCCTLHWQCAPGRSDHDICTKFCGGMIDKNN